LGWAGFPARIKKESRFSTALLIPKNGDALPNVMRVQELLDVWDCGHIAPIVFSKGILSRGGLAGLAADAPW
jgi:hypothetical protein